MATATEPVPESEMTILARILCDESGRLPDKLARYILGLDLSDRDRDRARMHDLATRNQSDDLMPAEKEEMIAFGKATTLLAVLKSRARRALGIQFDTRPEP